MRNLYITLQGGESVFTHAAYLVPGITTIRVTNLATRYSIPFKKVQGTPAVLPDGPGKGWVNPENGNREPSGGPVKEAGWTAG